jgi:hypothetical protein
MVHKKLALQADQPIAALLSDLKARACSMRLSW